MKLGWGGQVQGDSQREMEGQTHADWITFAGLWFLIIKDHPNECNICHAHIHIQCAHAYYLG